MTRSRLNFFFDPSLPDQFRHQLTPQDQEKILKILEQPNSTFPNQQKLPAKINLIFVGNALIRRLNRKYRGLDESTDVLSFNYEENNPPAPASSADKQESLGEIYISLPYLESTASPPHKNRKKLVYQTIIHGILHLAGYDHQTSEEEKAMRALTEKIEGCLEDS